MYSNEINIQQVYVEKCKEEQFDIVKNYITQMQLDNRNLVYKDFVVALLQNKIVGFGRLRIYKNCAEISSIGVIENCRRKGIGKKIIFSLINIFYQKNKFNRKNLYVVTIIPDYFLKFGFIATNDNLCEEIQEKLEYCTKELYVPEKYVIMRLNSPQSNLPELI